MAGTVRPLAKCGDDTHGETNKYGESRITDARASRVKQCVGPRAVGTFAGQKRRGISRMRQEYCNLLSTTSTPRLLLVCIRRHHPTKARPSRVAPTSVQRCLFPTPDINIRTLPTHARGIPNSTLLNTVFCFSLPTYGLLIKGR
jgi:hypothetical protein